VRHSTASLALAFALAFGSVAAPAPASAEPEGWAYEVAAELMSPFCPGRTLADCPSDQAKSLVLWIVVQEAAGRTRADVEEELLTRYGEVMRPAPKAEGIGLTAYIIPALAFAGGGALVGVFLKRQTRGRQAAAAVTAARPAPVSDPELERLVDEELART
jgi:cytochrome c-type biogenesis protein CcmH/NrfF